MSPNEIVRFEGRVIWLDLTTGDKVDEGTRSGEQQQQFRGTWDCVTPKGREHGDADCTLDPKPDYYLMSGVWAHGKCHWFARLEPVEQFAA